MKVVYYLASSLDGFIADQHGAVSWLDELDIDHSSSGYESFYEEVDGLIMGRATYDFVHDYGQWPYGEKPTWVCTRRELSVLEDCHLQPSNDPATAVAEASAMGIKCLWVVGGGLLAGSLIELGLMTHISVSIMPVMLGDGISLMATLPGPAFLQQISSSDMAGFTQVEYIVKHQTRKP